MSDTLIVGIDAKDNATPILEKFRKSITQVSSDIDKASNANNAFSDSLLNAANKIPGLNSGISGISSALTMLKNPVVEVTLAFGGALASMVHFADANEKNILALSKMSAQTGISVNALSALKKISAESDISLETMVSGVSKLEKNLGTNSAALKKLGIDSSDPIEALAQLADRMAATNNPMERAKIGSEALGKSFAELTPILSKGGDALRKVSEASTISQAMVDRYKEMHQNQLKINSAFGAWRGLLGDIMSGPLSVIYSIMAKMAQKAKEIADQLRKARGQEASQDAVDATMQKAAQAGNKTEDAYRKSHPKSTLFFQSDTAAVAENNRVRNKVLLDEVNKMAKDQRDDFIEKVNQSGKSYLDGYRISQVTLDKLSKTLKNDTKVTPLPDDKIKEVKDKTEEDEYKGIEDHVKAEQNAQDEIARYRNETILASIQDGREKDHVALTQKITEEEDKAEGNKEVLAAIWEKYRVERKNIDDKWDKKDLEDKIRALDKEIAAQEKVTNKSNENKKKAEEELQKILKAERKQWESIAKTIESALTAPYSNFIKNITRGNKSLFSSFKDLASDMKDAFGNAIIDMCAKYLAEKSAMYVTDLALQGAALVKSLALGSAATATATAESVAGSTVAAAAAAPAAALTSTWSFGTAAIAGGIALAAILALAKSSYAVGSTNIADDQIAQIHKGEMIIPARESQAAREGNLSPMLGFIGHNSSLASSGNSGGNSANPIQININGTNLTPKKVATQVVSELRYYQKQNTWRRN